MSDRHTEGPHQDRVPSGIDFSVPSVARMYDYFLDGKDNFRADREAAEQLSDVSPGSRAIAVNNRLYLRRAVRELAQRYGVTQFLDHGSGLPTQNNVHEIAQSVHPAARVVYVDNDPIVLAHGRALLMDTPTTAVITADMRDTDAVMTHPDVVKLLDFEAPVAALFVSVLHCIPDSDDPGALLGRVVDRLPSGSFVAVSHLVSESATVRERLTAFMLDVTRGNWGRVRAPEEIEGFFAGAGLRPLAPGLVEVSAWRPDGTDGPVPESTEWFEFGGVARKP